MTELYKLKKQNIEPMEVTHTFKNLSDFKKWFGYENPYRDDDTVLFYWSWIPSFNKAKKYNLTHVLDFFDLLDDDDEYKYGENGVSSDDDRNWIVYKDSDYLLLYTHRISNGFFETSYKITVTDNDEQEVRQIIKKMVIKTMKNLSTDNL